MKSRAAFAAGFMLIGLISACKRTPPDPGARQATHAQTTTTRAPTRGPPPITLSVRAEPREAAQESAVGGPGGPDIARIQLHFIPRPEFRIDSRMVGTAGRFSLSRIAGKGAAPSVSWDFGDGTSATGLTASHTFPEAKEYRVTARVGPEHRSQSIGIVVRGYRARLIADGAYFTCAVLDESEAAVVCHRIMYTTDSHDKLVSEQIQNGLPRDYAGNATARVHQLTVGATHACAATDAGIWCWGANGYGQLGQGHLDAVDGPRKVPLDAAVTQIAAGSHHTCATTKHGRLFCWGDNTAGQVEPARSSSELAAPREVTGIAGKVLQVAAGESHSCALVEENRVQCWGAHSNGRLGSDLPSDTTSIVDVELALGTIVSLKAGDSFTCAQSESGTAWCWGVLPLTDEARDARRATPVVALTPTQLDTRRQPVAALAISAADLCWVTRDGAYDCRGDQQAPLEDHPAELSAISNSGRCFVTRGDTTATAGTIFCSRSGIADFGRSPARRQSALLLPGVPPDQEGFQQTLDAGSTRCALSPAGAVQCWGSDFDEYFGRSVDRSRFVTTASLDFAGVNNTDVVVGQGYICGRRDDKSGWCIRYPVRSLYAVERFADLEALARYPGTRDNSDRQFCRLHSGGEIQCFGSSHYLSTGPLQLPEGVVSRHLAVGRDVVCMLSNTAQAYCWGVGITPLDVLAKPRSGEPANLVLADSLGEDLISLGIAEHRVCARNSKGIVRCTDGGAFGAVTWVTGAEGR